MERKTACGFHSIVADPTPKRRKIDDHSMENINISDDVVHNILSRLSAKPLMRFRCACKHWNSLINDPKFINSRSRRMTLFSSGRRHLYAFDDNHPNVVKLTYPFEDEIYTSRVIGTLNGIVILVLQNRSYVNQNRFILYNPLTRATKKLPDPPYNPCCFLSESKWAYGFDHENIIIGRYICPCMSTSMQPPCHVFNLKTCSWTTPNTNFYGRLFKDHVGMYVNGFLHWIYMAYTHMRALDVKELVFTDMDAPYRRSDNTYNVKSSVLGTLHGCLCLVSKWQNGFDVWVMMKNNEERQSEWSKQYSFRLPSFHCGYGRFRFLDVCILDDGRIVVGDSISEQVIICHLSERYYDIFDYARQICEFDKGIEYVESMLSPLDICNV